MADTAKDQTGRTEIEVVTGFEPFIVNVPNVDAIDNDFLLLRLETETLPASPPLQGISTQGILVGLSLPKAQLLKDRLEQLLSDLAHRLGKRMDEKFPRDGN